MPAAQSTRRARGSGLVKSAVSDVSWPDEPGWSEEETDNALYADDRNFYKLEKWTKHGTKADRML
jgi:hypothetical protein